MTSCSRSSKPSIRLPDSVSSDLELRFAGLVVRTSRCQACPGIGTGQTILSRANGPVPSEVMLVGEAPGWRGAAHTGVPFQGDQSARNLDHLLAVAGWTRNELFITNAVLCHPCSPNGQNRRPDASEIRCCSVWLREQIALVDPIVIGARGVVGLMALGLISSHAVELRRDVGRATPWNGRLLVPLYHPSHQARIHRSLATQETDFRALRNIWEAARQDRQ